MEYWWNIDGILMEYNGILIDIDGILMEYWRNIEIKYWWKIGMYPLVVKQFATENSYEAKG